MIMHTLEPASQLACMNVQHSTLRDDDDYCFRGKNPSVSDYALFIVGTPVVRHPFPCDHVSMLVYGHFSHQALFDDTGTSPPHDKQSKKLFAQRQKNSKLFIKHIFML